MIGAPFITVDALDGVGKTTLVKDLARRLGGQGMDTPGALLRPMREDVLSALGPAEEARFLFYAATVIAEGTRARAVTSTGIPVVMDRYWPSTVAYARARGVHMPLSGLIQAIPQPDVAVMLTLEESTRVDRLHGRGPVSTADAETLSPVFRRVVQQHLRRLTTVEVSMDGADLAEAVERVYAAILPQITHLQLPFPTPRYL